MVWDTRDGRIAHQLTVTGEVWGVVFLPKARLAVIADGRITVFDLENAAPPQTISASKNSTWFAASPDSRRLVTAGWDFVVRTWDLQTGEELLHLDAQSGALTAVAWSSNGKWLATSGLDLRVKIWDAEEGRLLFSLPGHTAPVRALSFNPDNRSLASAGADATIRIWDLTQGQEAETLRGHAGHVYGLVHSPDGRFLFSGGIDHTVRQWTIPIDATGLVIDDGDSVHDTRVQFGPGGEWLATAGIGEELRVLDPRTGLIRWSIELPYHGAHDVKPLAVDPSGGTVAVGGAGVQVLSAKTGELIWHEPAASRSAVMAVAYSPDGRLIATGSSQGSIELRDAVRGKLERAIAGVPEPVRSLVFHPDGRLVCIRARRAEVYDATAGQLWRTLDAPEPAHFLAAATDPARPQLAVADDRGAVTIWDLDQARLLQTLSGHAGDVHDLCYSPDGTRLASIGKDRNVKLWDLESGNELLTLRGQPCEGALILAVFSCELLG